MSSKTLFISLLALVICLPAICFSEPPNPKVWEPLRNNFFYNVKVIMRSPDIRLVWTYGAITDDVRARKIEDLQQYDVDQAVKYENFDHETFLWEIDCKNRQMRMEEFIDFDKNAKVLDRYRFHDNVWSPIPANTGGDALYRKVCFPSENIPQKNKPAPPRSASSRKKLRGR